MERKRREGSGGRRRGKLVVKVPLKNTETHKVHNSYCFGLGRTLSSSPPSWNETFCIKSWEKNLAPASEEDIVLEFTVTEAIFSQVSTENAPHYLFSLGVKTPFFFCLNYSVTQVSTLLFSLCSILSESKDLFFVITTMWIRMVIYLVWGRGLQIPPNDIAE